jgi:hypothetical protein
MAGIVDINSGPAVSNASQGGIKFGNVTFGGSLNNPNVMYALIGAAALVALLYFKKRR